MSTHSRKGNVLSFAGTEGNLRLKLADPMDWASGVSNDETSMGEGRVAEMGGGLETRACKVAVNIGIKVIEIGGLGLLRQ